jgi:glycosyltransferase involved in cell wall biosynthesis
MLSKGLSTIIPVYNSDQALPELILRFHEVLKRLGCSYEVIFVNDGSVDRSWDVVCQLAREYEWVRGINLMRNYGQHSALLCGIRSARYEVIVTMDDDLQNPPEEVPKLLKKLDEGYDVVYGTEKIKQHGFLRNIASRTIRLSLQVTMGIKIAFSVSSFRAFHTQLRKGFVHYNGPFVSIDVLLTWSTNKITSVQVQHEPRKIGESNYTFFNLLSHAVDMMTGFSTIPLKVASLLGFLLCVFGVGVFIYVIAQYLIHGGSVPGFPFLVSIITIFSGTQLFVLGVIGEYLARIHFRSMKRPSYTIRSSVGNAVERPSKD